MGAYPALDIKSPTPPDPLAEFARVSQIKSQMQAQQIQQQDLQIKQQQNHDLQATTSAINEADPKSPTYFDDVTQGIKKHGGSGNALTTWQTHTLAVQESQLRLTDEQRKQYLDAHKTIGDQLGTLADPTITPDDQLHGAASNVVNGLINAKYIDPQQGQQYQQLIQQTSDPAQLRASIGMISKNMQGVATLVAQQKTAAETEKAKADTAKANAEAESAQWQKFPEMGVLVNTKTGEVRTPLGQSIPPQMIESKYVQLAAKKSAGQPIAPEDAAFMKGVEKYKQIVPAATINLQSGLLNDQAKQMAAQMYAQTGQLPAGMRSPGMSAGILNAAAGGPAGVPDIAANKAGYQANTHSLESLQKNFDQVTAFENTAGKNLDVFLKTAKPILDSGSPWINKPLRAIDSGALGSADLAAFNTARQTAVTEIAKVLNSSNASGVLSDSARHEVEGLIGPNASLKQIYSAANILKQDMANRHQAYSDQIQAIKGRVSGKGEQPTAPTAPASGANVGTSGKAVSLSAARQLPQNKGKSDDEIKKDIESYGHTVTD